MELTGFISTEGVLKIENRALLDEWIVGNKGKPVALSFSVRKKRRSNPQNRFYFGVVVPLVREGINHFGHTISNEEAHEFLKSQFLKKELELSDGHSINSTQSTATLSTSEFSDYIAQIQVFASQMLNVIIPDPGEQSEINFK